MENKMFCFQCEQTAGCSGCTGKVGVCGKNADVAALQDKLTGELIGLVRATGDVVPTGNVLKLIIEGLFTTLTNVSFNEQTLNNEYDLSHIWTDNEDIRSLKSLILFGIRGMAAYAYHAMVLGYTNDEVSHFFVKALFALGEDWEMDKLLPIVMELGKVNLVCMEMLDKANTETYGTPTPTTIDLKVERATSVRHGKTNKKNLQMYLHRYYLQQTV